jgi:putative zinc finger/helix-turn-helix YgiT family protein
MSEQTSLTGRARPFPWRCTQCKEKEVYPLETDYTTTVKHDGRPYMIRIPALPIPTCRRCGTRTFTSEEDDRIVAALRVQLGLLTPREIQDHRSQLALSQHELAEQLGVAPEMISRWEAGALIQSQAMDNLLRLFFESEEVRTRLRRRVREKVTT